MQPELIADYQCVCGEGPLWHPMEQRVYWVDIETGRMFRYDPKTNTHEQFFSGHTVGGFTIQADGSLLLFMDRGSVKILRDGKLETVIDAIKGEEKSRFNDVIADPEGRVFCGTMPAGDQLGSLYRLDTDGSIHHILGGIGCSNGMGFTLDMKTMYYTDSEPREIYMFDYKRKSGEISNKRLFAAVSPEDGIPDGMTVDAEGYVWSARWDGNCLVRYNPKGEIVLRIEFPAKKVSSVIFGGPAYEDIYVTTAGGDNKKEEGHGAGALFRVRAGIKGRPEFFSRIGL